MRNLVVHVGVAVLAVAFAMFGAARIQSVAGDISRAAIEGGSLPIVTDLTPGALQRFRGEAILPGKYALEALVHMKGVSEDEKAFSLDTVSAGRKPIQGVLASWEISKSFELDPAKYGLAGCCIDQWKHLDFLIHDTDPNASADLGIFLSYRKFLKSGGPGPEILKYQTNYASGGKVDTKVDEKLLLSLEDVRWRVRSLSYVLKRLLGLAPDFFINVKQTSPKKTFVQFGTDIDLKGQQMLSLVLAPCGKVGEINLRFSANNREHLLTKLDRNAVISDFGQHRRAVVDLSSVRDTLGLETNASLRLREINLSFDMDQTQALSCKPLRAIAGISNAGPLSQTGVALKTRTINLGSGYRIFRVRLPTAETPWDWGHVLDKMVLQISRPAGTSHSVGIELAGVWGGNGASTKLLGESSSLCLVASRTFLHGLVSDPGGPCLIPQHHISMRSLTGAYQSIAARAAGVEFVPGGRASYRFVKGADALELVARFRQDSDRIKIHISALGVRSSPRLMKVSFIGSPDLELGPISDASEVTEAGEILVPAGQVPGFELSRRTALGSVTTLHRFQMRMVTVKSAADGHDGEVLQWPSSVFRLTVFRADGVPRMSGKVEALDPEREGQFCGRSPGLTVCMGSGLKADDYGVHLPKKGRADVHVAFDNAIKVPANAMILIRSDHRTRQRFELRIRTLTGLNVSRTGFLDEPLRLFRADEEIKSLTLTVAGSDAHVRRSEIAISDLLFLTGARADNHSLGTSGASTSVLRYKTAALEPEGIITYGDGVRATVSGDYVLLDRTPDQESASSDIAAWSYSMNVPIRDIVNLKLTNSFNSATCSGLTAFVKAEWSSKNKQGSGTLASSCPVDGSEWNIPRDGLFPDSIGLDSVLTKLVVKFSGVSGGPRSAYVGMDVSVSSLVPAGELIDGPDLLRVSDVGVSWDRPETSPKFWTAGGWVSLGQVSLKRPVSDSSLYNLFIPAKNPLFLVQAVRLRPLCAIDQELMIHRAGTVVAGTPEQSQGSQRRGDENSIPPSTNSGRIGFAGPC